MTPSEVLAKDERIELSLKPDLIATFLPAFLMTVPIMLVNATLFIKSRDSPLMFKFSLFVLSVSLIGLLFAFAKIYLTYLYTFYFVTDRRVIYQTGVISRDHRDCRLGRIQNIYVDVSFVGRILNVGNIAFSTAGEAGIEVAFARVRNPLEVKRKINEVIDRDLNQTRAQGV